MTDPTQTPQPTPKKGKASKKPAPKKAAARKPKPPGTLEHGRPSIFTAKVVEKFTTAVSIGSSYELASLYAGISYATYQNWMRQARAARLKDEAGEKLTPAEGELLNFLREVEIASAEAGITWQDVVHKAAKVDPNIALQMLRLRFSGYSPNQPMNYTAEIDLSTLTDDQLQRIANGEDPASVIASTAAGAGAPAPTPAAGGKQQPVPPATG